MCLPPIEHQPGEESLDGMDQPRVPGLMQWDTRTAPKS